MNQASTLERLIPAYLAAEDTTGQETFRIHAERYRFAARHARPGRLLDIACGVGYGTRILVDDRADITAALGLDISATAIAYAQANYAHARTEYRVGDALTFQAEAPFDTAVSLETIEHLPDAGAFLANLMRSLRPGARFIASVPVTPSVDANPHHLQDFTKASFRRLGTSFGLVEQACLEQVQPFSPLQILRRQEQRLADMRPNLLGYYLAHPDAVAKRVWSTLRHGFTNRYLTIAWEKT